MSTTSTLNIVITGNSASAQAALGGVQKSLASTGAATSKFSAVQAKLSSAQGIMGAVAVAAAVKFVSSSVQAANTVGEAMNKVQVVFGQSGQAVVDFSTTTSAAMGISQGAALEAAGGFGAMLQTAGVAEKASADMSTSLVTLAADMASFNNVDPSVMLEKLRAGLAGEAEPLRTTGVFLSEAAVQAEAFQSGIAEAGSVLTEAQKVQARYNLILSQTTKQQGDFGRTLGTSVPNQMRVVQASFTDFQAAIGKAFLPILSIILKGFIALVTALTPLATAFSAIVTFIGPVGQGLLALAVAILVVSAAVAFFSASLTFLEAIPIVAFVLAIAIAVAAMVKLVMAGLSALSGGWSKMSGVMKAVLIATAPLWLPIVAVIKLVQVGVQVLAKVFSAIGSVISGFASGVAQLWNDFLAGLGPVGDALMKVGDLLGIFADTAAANAITATAEMNTFGLSVVLAAQQGSAAAAEMGRGLMVLRTNMLALGQSTQWTAMMQAGLTSIDNALKSGNISVADAQKAYMAWGVSLDAAQARTAGLVPAINQISTAAQASFKTADVMGAAWESVGPKVSGSLKEIAKAITSSLKAELKLSSNTTKVTNRLIDDYGLTADQAERSLAGASPKAIQTMARASDKGFKQVGTAMQKANHITPSVVKGQEGLAKTATSTAKASQSGAKGQDDLAKASTKVAPAASKAATATTKLGSSVATGQSKVAGMTTNVAKLGTELNGLPKSIKIDVTVNVTKTGQQLGGIVPGLARGGVSSMPLTEVGETGREFAALPSGTRVYSHAETMGLSAAMRGGAGGGAGGPMTIRGKLQMVGSDAVIEGVVMEMLDDGSVLDNVLTKAMRRP